jgi:hypothetical protein
MEAAFRPAAPRMLLPIPSEFRTMTIEFRSLFHVTELSDATVR